MAYVKDMLLPRLAEGMESARVTRWLVTAGETVSAGETVMEIETDKSVIEVPAAEDALLVEQCVGVDDMIGPDEPIARIEVAGEAPPEAAPADAERPIEDEATIASAATSTAWESVKPLAAGSERLFATPAARRLAAHRGLDLATVRGTGPAGRVVIRDVAAVHASARAPAVVSDDEQEHYIDSSYGRLYVRQWAVQQDVIRGTVMLLHGLFGDAGVWAATGRELARAGLDVYAVDLPCHGRSEAVATDLDAIAEAAVAVVQATAPGPVALVGHSLGAGVALRIAGRGTVDVASLTLLACVGLGTEINQSFLDGMLHADTLAAVRRELRKLTVAGMMPSEQYVETVCERLKQRREPLSALLRGIANSGVQQLDLAPLMAELDCPLTLVHGRSDAIVPWQHVLNAPPRAALHLIPNVGHMPQWEASALTTRLVVERARRY